jgi:hypothetical protein
MQYVSGHLLPMILPEIYVSDKTDESEKAEMMQINISA